MNTAEGTKPEIRVFLGSPDHVRDVRAFVSEVVGGCPVIEDAILLSSEVATNAILHSASGKGGTFTVVVVREAASLRVEVHDCGSENAPDVRMSRTPAESGSGLYLVEEIATRWGCLGGRDGRIVWFELEWS